MLTDLVCLTQWPGDLKHWKSTGTSCQKQENRFVFGG